MQKSPFSVPDLPKRILIGLQDGYCNLKCPACYVHGNGNRDAVRQLRGQMPLEAARRVFNELKDTGRYIHPTLWSEPFLIKDAKQYIQAMKANGLHVFINTNGLLLDNEMARFLVDVQIHTLFVSIDAATPESLKKMRGVEDLDQIKKAVFRMLEARRDRTSPRIGVSFIECEKNAHEKNDFIAYWIKHVDVIRVNAVYETDNRIRQVDLPDERMPCGALYDTMSINHKGDVPICCLDSFNTTCMGNVFRQGLQNVWLGEKLQKIRYLHESKQFDKIPLCRNCDVWANYLIQEKESDGILIRTSPVMTYYNRLDKMYTWHSRIR